MKVTLTLNKKQVGLLYDIVDCHLKALKKEKCSYTPYSYNRMVKRILNKLPNFSENEIYK